MGPEHMGQAHLPHLHDSLHLEGLSRDMEHMQIGNRSQPHTISQRTEGSDFSSEFLSHHSESKQHHNSSPQMHQSPSWSQGPRPYAMSQPGPSMYHMNMMRSQMHTPPVMTSYQTPQQSTHNQLTNQDWDNQFDQAQSMAQPKQSDDLAIAAGQLIDGIDMSANPKLKDSVFLNTMQKIRDGEVKVEGNDLVQSDGQGMMDPKTADDWSQEYLKLQQNAKEGDELVEQLNPPKSTIAELTDDEFEKAFDFGNWVDKYGEEINSMTDDPQNIEWAQLARDWEKYSSQGEGYRADNPLYETYLFSTTNPFLSAPTPVIEQACQSQDLAEALLALEAKVQQNPNDGQAWYKLGVRQQENEREPAAIASLRKALEIQPDLLEAHMALAVSYTNEGHKMEAFDSLQAWIHHHPTYGHLEKEMPTATSDRYTQVFDLYIKSIQSNLHQGIDPNVQIGLGVLLNISEEYEKAVDCFKTALTVLPNDYMLWNKLGATYANSHEPNQAIEAYFNALELNPTFIRARYNLAVSSINLGQYYEAAEHLLAALALQVQDKSIPNPNGPGMSDLPHDVMSSSSSHVWDTLKMTLHMMNKPEMVPAADAHDLEAFRQMFTF
jgi:peroxin-5